MSTQSVYVLGGAGCGKSTFSAQVLMELGLEVCALEDLWAKRNAKALVTLRGHPVGESGMYLGVLREHFPGTDGLDRASSATGVDWLLNAPKLPEWLYAEGATLATKPFLGTLADRTNLLVVHFSVSEEVRQARFAARGSNQDSGFVASTVTRSANRAAELLARGVSVLELDAGDPAAWDEALDVVLGHLLR